MNNLKIVAIAGSNNKNSFTENILCKQLERLSCIQNSLEYEVLSLSNYNVKSCNGCEQCFKYGLCMLDNVDDFSSIKNKIMTADIVIWGSPVYVGDVSSIMKILIERLALSCHTLDFAGTYSYTLTTTKRTGGERVSEYLRNIQLSMGFKNIDNYIFTKDYDILENFILSTSDKLLKKYDENFGFSNKVLESQFSKLRSFYKELNIRQQDYNHINEYEREYWNQNWIKECKSFQEYATKNIVLKKVREI